MAGHTHRNSLATKGWEDSARNIQDFLEKVNLPYSPKIEGVLRHPEAYRSPVPVSRCLKDRILLSISSETSF